MNLNFVVNDYVLIWNLLFEASISESIHKLKQKIWANYKNEYNTTYKDKELILKDPKNFIPNDDTIYNILLETKEYEKIAREAEKYRLEVMKIWDKNKKKIHTFIRKILKKDIKPYKIYIVNEELDILDISSHKTEDTGVVILGKKIDKTDPLKLIIDLILTIINKEIKDLPEDLEKTEVREATVELAILNELSTNLKEKSCYDKGEARLTTIKHKIYPYWLMYLGIPKEEFFKYMMRDKIAFESDEYAYEKELRKMDLEEFVDFCTRNKKYIIRHESTAII